MHFDSGTLRLAIAPWDIVSGGNTYTHTGPLLTIGQAKESAGSNEGLDFSMSGLDPIIFTLATQEPYQGRVVRLLKAFIDADTNALIDTPKAQFNGRMRNMVISEKNDSCTVIVTAEHYDVDLRNASPMRYNDADQQRLFPGDLGCAHVESMAEKQLIWPSKEALRR
jgi:hypothetical protein